MPNGDSITRLTGIAVVRADDLLDLTFTFQNLGLRGSGAPALVRVVPSADAFVVVGFPPQSVGEASSQGFEGEFPLASALSEPSRLAFRVPPGVAEIPFDLKGLLSWTSLTPSLAANAIGLNDPRPDPPPGPAPPPPTATAIEAPFRLVLSPGPQGRWAFARAAVTRAGVTELWHARLGSASIFDSEWLIRPVWTPDMRPFGSSPVETPLTRGNRRDIVRLGGDLRRAGNTPAPVMARRLVLSARGAWFEGDGGWDEPDPIFPPALNVDIIAGIDDALDELRLLPPDDPQELEARKLSLADQVVDSAIPGGLDSATEQAMKRALIEPLTQDPGEAGRLLQKLLDALPPRAHFEWSHRMLQGRDDAVRTVTPGVLLPWGIPVDMVRETAREFVGGSLFSHAALVTRASIRVRVAARSFPASQYPHGGRETPFVSCQLMDDVVRPVLPVDTTAAAWLRTPDGASDLMWTVVCSDRAFKPVAMSMALLFVPHLVAADASGAAAAWVTYTSDPRSAVDLGGQSVTLTENDTRGTTTMTVHAMSFGGATPSASSSMPTITRAEVSAPAVNALLGTAGAGARVPFKFHESYLRAGFDAAQNPSQVFADLRKVVDGAAVSAFDITSIPERAGGLMRPDLAVQGLSKLVGPLPEVDKVVAGVMDPTRFIPDVKILGGYSLKELVAPIVSGLTPGDLGALVDLDPSALWTKLQEQTVRLPMPALTSRKIGPVDAPTAVETRFVWKPLLNLQAVLPRGLKLDPGARLVVLSTITAPLDGSAPGFESKGELANFAIHFADVVKVQLATLTFVARAGRKLELDATGVRLTFEGQLAFVERIRQFIPPEGFSDPPSVAVTPTGITAGYTLGLPAIGVGVFSLENVGLSAALELPFVEGSTRLRFALSERHDPFLVTVSLFGGGGFLGITLDTGGGVGVEGAIEFGGNFCLDLIVASGGVHVMAGIYFKMAGTVVELSGYLRVGGAVTVLGVITVSVEFYLALTYIHDSGPPPLNKVAGDAVLTVGVDVLFLHQDVTLHVHREFANPVGDPTFEDLVSLEAWTTYCDAYAA